MKRSGKRFGIILSGVIVLGLLAGGTWWRRAEHVRASIAVVLPARPDLTGVAPELFERIAVAEERARSLRSSIAGLAELARLYHANGYLTEASACERALIQIDPSNPLWPYLHAHIVGGFGDLEQAIPLLQHVVELAPDYLPARVRLGDMLLKRNENEKAAEIYRAVVNRDPSHGYAIIGLARVELAENNPLAARQRLLHLVAAQPGFTPAWGLLISIDEQLGDEAAAETHRMQSRSSGRPREMPDPWIDDLMVDCYDAYRLSVAASAADPADNQARARQLLERAVMIAPNNDLPFRLLGNLLSDLGELPKARGYLERAAAIDPKEPDNWSHLVRVLKAMGDMTAANRALDTGLVHCPEAPVLHLERGRRLAAVGQFDDAIAAFQWARQLRPEDPAAPMELAGAYFKQGRLEEGLVELRNVVKIDPNHPVAVVLLARHAIGSGDEAGAVEWIARARRLPRVPPGDLQRVAEEFRVQFGRAP